ncbi:MAG: hemolysin III family protein [Pseudomonadota bacterium]
MAYMYSFPERVADGTVHILGIAASIAATTALILWAAQDSTALTIASVAVYGAFATLTFTVSAIYHMTPWQAARPWLQRIDHASIYLKIAGTYTPLVVILGNVFGYIVLACIWTAALAGAVGKLTDWLQPGWGSTALYAALGWASVVLLGPLIQAVPAQTVWLMVAGGALYTGGAVINHMEHMRYNVAIWHAFVLTASALFFAAIVIAL